MARRAPVAPAPVAASVAPVVPAAVVLPAALVAVAILAAAARGAGPSPPAIVVPAGAGSLERLAAREVRRYVYLRTGRVVRLVPFAGELPRGGAIVVARAGRKLLRALPLPDDLRARIAGLGPSGYVLRSVMRPEGRLVIACGGDGTGTLYAAYRLAERTGVRFALHGDVVPDRRTAPDLPALDGAGEVGRPLFELRGIQPFHDFPEGPDWWSLDDYLAVIAQLPKLRFNFIGLHTYPEGKPNAEPTVWIGLPEEIGEGPRVRAAYPASYQNTLRGNWGYEARPTRAFHFGAAALFDRDAWGAEVMRGMCPRPATLEDETELFARTARLLRQAFEHARSLGVRTCAGTETPLTIPERLRERLAAAGRDPDDLATLVEVYEGIFRRIAQAYPLDYYWFWTPESWTWKGTRAGQVHETVRDLEAAIEAARRVQAPFALATCGWVLGPQSDRALFDRILPASIALSCINREVGKTPVDSAFARVKRPAKWAIPWLEDDPALTAAQLWAGRMRRDAAEALRYGCSGLLGIHWRTRPLAPAVLALSRAAWTQEGWKRIDGDGRDGGDHGSGRPGAAATAPLGGKSAAFTAPIDGTELDAVYRTVRYGLSGYRLALPDGRYRITLQFCEPHHDEVGERVFGVRVGGRDEIAALDILAAAGRNRALDIAFDDVVVSGGTLDIEFLPRVEYPLVAGIVAERCSGSRIAAGDASGALLKINCGGPACRDYLADPEPAAAGSASSPPVGDLYLDWATHEFGPDIGAAAAAIFERLDGRVPRPAEWVRGPGGLRPDPRSWAEVAPQYAFTEELDALCGRIRGAGERSRFEYWLHQFHALRAAARVRCEWGRFEEAMEEVRAVRGEERRRELARDRVLPVRRRLVAAVAEVFDELLASVSTTGGLGTIANWEQHILPEVLERPGKELEAMLGSPLPPDALPGAAYRGPPRLFVPAVRTLLRPGESLSVGAIVLDRAAPRSVVLRWRRLGAGEFVTVPFEHTARGRYRAVIRLQTSQTSQASGRARERTAGAGGAACSDIEYFVEVRASTGELLRFPVTAPEICQTVILAPAVTSRKRSRSADSR